MAGLFSAGCGCFVDCGFVEVSVKSDVNCEQIT